MSWHHLAQRTLFVRALRHLYQGHILHSKGSAYEKEVEQYFRSCGIDVQPHPHGTHRWPDLWVASSIPVELKTSNRSIIHLGATFPPPRSVYVIRAGLHTHITLGEDLVPSVYRTNVEQIRASIMSNRTCLDSLMLQPRLDLTIRLKESTREFFFQRVIDHLLDQTVSFHVNAL